MLDLLYITNDPAVASVAQNAGVDEIFIDLERRGKRERQRGRDTVISSHTVGDAAAVRAVLDRARLLVRTEPLWEGSAREIDAAVDAGADIVMLPYFRTVGEARRFLELCAGRVETRLLVETPEAVAALDEILSLPGVGSIHIGLNDLHLGLGKKFMFELLCDGTVEKICHIAREHGVPCGIGGVASLGQGLLPAENVLAEHYRLGSSGAILSRSFCRVEEHTDLAEIERIFTEEVGKIRAYEAFLSRQDADFFERNRIETALAVRKIAEGMA